MPLALITLFLAVFFLGAWTASFSCLIVDRLPRRQSIALPRSHCPHCHHTLTILELWPILGWLSCGGKCRRCAARIPRRYPVIEGMYGLIFVMILCVFGVNWSAAAAILLVCAVGFCIIWYEETKKTFT